jgi:hypothetical protein
MTPSLTAQFHAGLPALRGARAHGVVPIRGDVLATLLRHAPAPLRDVRLEVQAHNRLVVRYGVLQATAVLDEALAVGASPRLGLDLASSAVAWTLRQVLRLPYVRVEGRRVTVDLAAVPALAACAPLWPHLRDVRLATSPGVILVGVEVLVA